MQQKPNRNRERLISILFFLYAHLDELTIAKRENVRENNNSNNKRNGNNVRSRIRVTVTGSSNILNSFSTLSSSSSSSFFLQLGLCVKLCFGSFWDFWQPSCLFRTLFLAAAFFVTFVLVCSFHRNFFAFVQHICALFSSFFSYFLPLPLSENYNRCWWHFWFLFGVNPVLNRQSVLKCCSFASFSPLKFQHWTDEISFAI